MRRRQRARTRLNVRDMLEKSEIMIVTYLALTRQPMHFLQPLPCHPPLEDAVILLRVHVQRLLVYRPSRGICIVHRSCCFGLLRLRCGILAGSRSTRMIVSCVGIISLLGCLCCLTASTHPHLPGIQTLVIWGRRRHSIVRMSRLGLLRAPFISYRCDPSQRHNERWSGTDRECADQNSSGRGSRCCS